MRLFASLCCLLFASKLFGVEIKEISPGEIEKKKELPCVLMHIWATWCPHCIEELPQLLKILGEQKTIVPVVVDLSSPYMQKHFSNKWVPTLKPKFETYARQAAHEDEAYLKAIDPKWDGSLPYTLFFSKKKKLKSWVGSLALKKFKSDIEALCKR